MKRRVDEQCMFDAVNVSHLPENVSAAFISFSTFISLPEWTRIHANITWHEALVVDNK